MCTLNNNYNLPKSRPTLGKYYSCGNINGDEPAVISFLCIDLDLELSVFLLCTIVLIHPFLIRYEHHALTALFFLFLGSKPASVEAIHMNPHNHLMLAPFFYTEINEYCRWETFNATCPGNSVILMRSARYGRMQRGRCLQRDYYTGCAADVMIHADSRCSGRRSCFIGVPDETLHEVQPCPKDIMAYLEAGYECVPGGYFTLIATAIEYR